MVCTAVFLSSVFSSPAAATSFVLVYVFFSGILGFQLFEYYFPANPPWLHAVQIIPSFSLFRALYEITQHAALTTLQNVSKHQFAQRWDNIKWDELGAPMVSMAMQAVVLLAAGLTVDHVRVKTLHCVWVLACGTYVAGVTWATKHGCLEATLEQTQDPGAAQPCTVCVGSPWIRLHMPLQALAQGVAGGCPRTHARAVHAQHLPGTLQLQCGVMSSTSTGSDCVPSPAHGVPSTGLCSPQGCGSGPGHGCKERGVLWTAGTQWSRCASQ